MANTAEDTVTGVAQKTGALDDLLKGKNLAEYAAILYQFALDVDYLQKNCECCGNPDGPPPPPPPSA